MPFDGKDYQPNKEIDAAVEALRATRMRLCLPDLWCKKMAQRDGRFCLGKAVGLGATKSTVIRMAEGALLDAANRLFPKEGFEHRSIQYFNDDPRTTFERLHEVIDLAEETLKERRV